MYNGKTFDVPFIEKYFGIRMNHAHIDLRYVLKSLGYAGGLKRCEKALGLDRGEENQAKVSVFLSRVCDLLPDVMQHFRQCFHQV
jgi:uncharacterized protein YprB with RNaseH-like and TPR domain